MSAPTYEFTPSFETKIAALCLRDDVFRTRVDGLISPEYFNDEATATLVQIWDDHWKRYRTIAKGAVAIKLLSDAIAAKRIRKDIKDDVISAFKLLMKTDISDRDYVVDEVASFAKHQAIINAMSRSVDLLDKRKFAEIESIIKSAFDVAPNEDGQVVDFFSEESIERRAQRRKDVVSGKVTRGISTGVRKLDDVLAHKGWGYSELSVIMGGAKAGKSFWLMNSGAAAAMLGNNVLHVSLENSVEVTEDRAEAFVTGVETNKLTDHIAKVEADMKAKSAAGKFGKYMVHAYSPNQFSPSDLRRLIERYRARGVKFEMIVIDYWDIMAPELRYKDDKIAESASIGMSLRSIAHEENCVMLTAIQTNREGYKAHTAGAEHAAEDFNKVRLADLLVSINADEDEKATGEARLFMAAGRNQEDGYTMSIKRNLAVAKFIDSVVASGTI
jgi:replicative DNA helicase